MMKVPDTKENMMKCICTNCPTFSQSPLTGGFFCAKGKAKQTVIEFGCNCRRCPIFIEFGLQGEYFCK